MTEDDDTALAAVDTMNLHASALSFLIRAAVQADRRELSRALTRLYLTKVWEAHPRIFVHVLIRLDPLCIRGDCIRGVVEEMVNFAREQLTLSSTYSPGVAVPEPESDDDDDDYAYHYYGFYCGPRFHHRFYHDCTGNSTDSRLTELMYNVFRHCGGDEHTGHCASPSPMAAIFAVCPDIIHSIGRERLLLSNEIDCDATLDGRAQCFMNLGLIKITPSNVNESFWALKRAIESVCWDADARQWEKKYEYALHKRWTQRCDDLKADDVAAKTVNDSGTAAASVIGDECRKETACRGLGDYDDSCDEHDIDEGNKCLAYFEHCGSSFAHSLSCIGSSASNSNSNDNSTSTGTSTGTGAGAGTGAGTGTSTSTSTTGAENKNHNVKTVIDDSNVEKELSTIEDLLQRLYAACVKAKLVPCARTLYAVKVQRIKHLYAGLKSFCIKETCGPEVSEAKSTSDTKPKGLPLIDCFRFPWTSDLLEWIVKEYVEDSRFVDAAGLCSAVIHKGRPDLLHRILEASVLSPHPTVLQRDGITIIPSLPQEVREKRTAFLRKNHRLSPFVMQGTYSWRALQYIVLNYDLYSIGSPLLLLSPFANQVAVARYLVYDARMRFDAHYASKAKEKGKTQTQTKAVMTSSSTSTSKNGSHSSMKSNTDAKTLSLDVGDKCSAKWESYLRDVKAVAATMTATEGTAGGTAITEGAAGGETAAALVRLPHLPLLASHEHTALNYHLFAVMWGCQQHLIAPSDLGTKSEEMFAPLPDLVYMTVDILLYRWRIYSRLISVKTAVMFAEKARSFALSKLLASPGVVAYAHAPDLRGFTRRRDSPIRSVGLVQYHVPILVQHLTFLIKELDVLVSSNCPSKKNSKSTIKKKNEEEETKVAQPSETATTGRKFSRKIMDTLRCALSVCHVTLVLSCRKHHDVRGNLYSPQEQTALAEHVVEACLDLNKYLDKQVSGVHKYRNIHLYRLLILLRESCSPSLLQLITRLIERTMGSCISRNTWIRLFAFACASAYTTSGTRDSNFFTHMPTLDTYFTDMGTLDQTDAAEGILRDERDNITFASPTKSAPGGPMWSTVAFASASPSAVAPAIWSLCSERLNSLPADLYRTTRSFLAPTSFLCSDLELMLVVESAWHHICNGAAVVDAVGEDDEGDDPAIAFEYERDRYSQGGRY